MNGSVGSVCLVVIHLPVYRNCAFGIHISVCLLGLFLEPFSLTLDLT